MSDPSSGRFAAWRSRLAQARTYGRRALPFTLGVAATLLALLLARVIAPPPAPLSAADISTTVAQVMASATPAPPNAALVFQAIQPSLVRIQTEGTSTNGRATEGVGSGVVISDAGAILTSLHVVTGATTIQVTFADGTQTEAKIAAQEPANDIAVLQVAGLPAQVVPATLGNPHAMHVGDEAFVVGHPLGLPDSLSSGVISGFDRVFQPNQSAQPLRGLIQIDAAVNPGNSGGPLLNRAGQVVGIVAGLVNPTDQNVFIGLGFAVPIDVAGGAAGLPPY